MLKDLHELGVTLQNSYQTTFTPEDKELPSLFKQLVNNIEGSAVSYNRNSFVVTINYSNQKIYFPNQLWYIAAYFADFYKALSEYAQIIKTHLRLSDDNIKKAKDNREIANSLISSASVDDEDKEYLIRFLSDYDWWFGGKGIERADYYVSPILSLCKLVNASQSYVADLCKYLAKNDDALNILKHINEKRGLNKIQIFEDSVLNSFVYKLFKYIEKEDSLNALIPYAKYSNANRIGLDDTLIHLELDDKRTHSIFIQTTDESNISARNSGKIKRWYEHIFHFDQKKVYLTTQWSADTIDILIFIINHAYKGKLQIDKIGDNCILYTLKNPQTELSNIDSSYLPYLTALRTKPFMLLAGISGTGKSRIVREMAKACWTPEEDEYGKNCPRNFCVVQVKPNWHDSSDLIGYVSRINGEKYVVGPFLRFIAKAIKDPKRPYFLCLDEMNLAPVEQYFAEYLSVIESRKLQDGHIETDPIVPFEVTEAYGSLIDQLFDSDEERKAYKTEEGGKRLTIPENLFVVGTVNMDETTFSFSRKVLDRAMTIEMNEVNLKGGLEAGGSAEFGYIGEDLMGDAAEGKDIYADNQALCDDIITYLGKVNEILEGTPFKIAYRTRNEFLLYAVNRLHFATDSELWQTLDEMTSMKILSRIEGDNERCERVLREMKQLLTETVGEHAPDSVSLKKIDEMTLKLKSGYTSYWA